MSPYRLLLILAIVFSVWAAPEWTYIRSDHFELITTAGSGEGRRTLEYFEQLREFFMRTHSEKMSGRLPVTIVLFRNMKEFQPYSPNAVAGAFYAGDGARDYIVMSGGAEDDRPVAVHEYMHLLVRGLELNLPLWLNEGIADVYSTLRPYGGKIAVGMVPKGRAFSLALEKWIPLERVLRVQHDSPEYNESNRAGAFYAQSWMLTHMLVLGAEYSQNFSKFLGTSSAGEPSESAFRMVYGKSIADVDRDLQAYYRASSLKAALFDVKLQKFSGFVPTPADPFFVELNLSRVAALSGRSDAAVERLRVLAKAHPDRWEVHEALGNVAWKKNDIETAKAALRRAVELQAPVWTVYWDYARVAQSDAGERESVLAALRKAVQLNGASVDARLMLGQHLYIMQKYAESLEAYSVIRTVTPDRAPRLFLGRAYALMQLEKFDEVRSLVAQALKYAKEPNDTEAANRLTDYLDRRERAEKERREWQEARRAVPMPPAPVRQDLAQPVEPGAGRPPSELLSTVQGLLKQVDCMVTSARLRIQAGDRSVDLLIADPDKILIRNKPGYSMNLTCGPQRPPAAVTVEYFGRADAKHQTSGEVRTIEFSGN